jgi:hypothetical protein
MAITENGRWRSPKTVDGDHRKRSMAITENGDGDRLILAVRPGRDLR